MYGTGLTYTRMRGGYHDRYDYPQSPWVSTAPIPAPRNRNPRYTRASTTSVTQMLSDSCSSLLQKLTTRVRGPSATVERHLNNVNNNNHVHHHNHYNNSNHNNNNNNNHTSKIEQNRHALSPSNLYTSARSRIEDKYASVLEKIYGRKKDPERTPQPSFGGALTKSATTSNVFLSEKSYPYVQTGLREKTPYKSESRRKQQYPEPPYTYLDRETAYRARQKSSNHSELRPRRSAKPLRTGKSESEQRRATLKLCPVEIPLLNDNNINNGFEDETTPTPSVPDPMSEREAKRKEIQSLIMKYSALDEAYNKSSGPSNDLPAVHHQSAAAAIAQKYHHQNSNYPPKTTSRVVVSSEITSSGVCGFLMRQDCN